MEDKSKRFQLNNADISRLLRSIAIYYSPVLLLFITQVEAGELDYRVLIALAVSVTADLLRRFIVDYTKE